jgi:proteasome activator subunit 4
MPVTEVKLHIVLLDELICNMSHSSAQIREAIGVILSVLCSNIRLRMSYQQEYPTEEGKTDVDSQLKEENWFKLISAKASEAVKNIQQASISDSLDTSTDVDMGNAQSNGDSLDDVKWMETLFHFIISSFKSGRASYLLDVIAGFLYPVMSLQETSHKDLSILAKAAFELLKWRVFPESHLQKVIGVILSSADDSNWRIRSSTLTYLRTFMYRHTFILTHEDKQKIWKTVEKLLVDSQVEVREHAAAVLAGLMKGGDEDFAADFRDRSYAEANSIQKRRNRRKSSSTQSIAGVHGAVLGLVASVLSVPYDMPSWLPEHVTLLARFAGEPTPIKSTVTKAVAEFRRTHADTWNIQKDSFTEDQLEILADTSSSSSYFA